MSKNPKPRWGYRAPGFDWEPAFTDEQIRHLAEIAGRLDDESVACLADMLRDVGNALTTVGYIVETETSPPEQRAAIKELAERSRTLLTCLQQVDPDTRRSIISCYPSDRLNFPSDTHIDNLTLFLSDIDRLERLTRAIETAPLRVPAGDGRPRNQLMEHAAVRLAEVYESFTGMEFRRSEKRGHDEPAKFVEAAMRTVAPNATNANIRVVLRYAATEMKSRRKNQKPPSDSG